MPAISARAACRTGFARCCRCELMANDRPAPVPTDRSPPTHPRPPAGEGAARADDDSLWVHLRMLTAARIGLRRTGASLATRPLLDFKLAHARARDAVREPLDVARLVADVAVLGLPVVAVASAAEDRQRYLMRPDLGRRLAPGAQTTLASHWRSGFDMVFVVADGLSARAVQVHAPAVLAGV